MTRQYTPSNGTEGREFEAKWCGRCACDEKGDLGDEDLRLCPILGDAYAGLKPAQWVQDVPGGPLCTAFIEDVGQGVCDPFQIVRDRARYDALPRDPITGRPVIA